MRIGLVLSFIVVALVGVTFYFTGGTLEIGIIGKFISLFGVCLLLSILFLGIGKKK